MSAKLFVSLAMYAFLLGGLLFIGRDWQPLESAEVQNSQQVQTEMPDRILARAHRHDRDCADASYTNIWCDE